MKRYSMLKTVGLALASMILITACSTMKGQSKAIPQRGDTADSPAQSSSVSDQSYSFQDEQSASTTLAPSDQVYYFDFNKNDVHQQDMPSIDAQANYLAANASSRIRLEGNADERGSREYNVALGWKRAKAVASILQQKGAADKQLVILSYGKEKPAAFGHDEKAYSLNRRVNLVYEVK